MTSTEKPARVKASGNTIRAEYPCCAKPCEIRIAREGGRYLSEPGSVRHETLERRHFCEPDDETGTLWRITWRVLGHGPDWICTMFEVTFLDLAATEAEHLYGAKRIPRRKLHADA